ncbi:CaiB/BaiF CoA transferase family protein [Adhaeribacter rhizoryzae]|uniref:CoA transferase n=1 Tax=Adhaeribacter rhizoryzae TaxID=2607907 RepID=A0A5M6DGX5_9BACT|nr:CoA transferase [Adhaeribacter rhizoryzae]KAA5546798.1 CoA transferase [Adhaeribacter rhizoryzae]
MRPLENLIVLEFCQYMAGPSAGLRLADFGARVIKIERPGTGEGGRKIAIKNLFAGDDSIVFHTINRNKESYEADLKDPADLAKIKKLIAQADVLTHNFRPGIMEKIGLSYEEVKKINPRLVYGVVTGYGAKGPWAAKPGQDLLVQSLSGLTYLSGDKKDDPTPFGIAVADIVCGAHLAQGILAALVRRGKTKQGALVEVSLLESVLDLQFELLTTYLNDGRKKVERAAQGNANAYLSAPYGVYKTRDGYLALAMENLVRLSNILGCDALRAFPDSATWFTHRDELMAILNDFLEKKTTAEWLAMLEPADIWCAEVYNYEQFLNHAGYQVLQMDQELQLPGKEKLRTTRCPIRIDGEKLYSAKPGPLLGQHNKIIDFDFNLTLV